MISIHAAREGGDKGDIVIDYDWYSFQSTPPVKAATYRLINTLKALMISIHAAREGGDQASFGFA